MTQYAVLSGGLFDGSLDGLKVNQGYVDQDGVGGAPGTIAGCNLVLRTDKLDGNVTPTLELNDNSHIKSPPDIGNHVLACRLDTQTIYPLGDPLTTSGFILTIRMRKDLASGGQVNALIELRQDYVDEESQGTFICQIQQTDLTPTLTTYTHTLTAPEVGLITNYSNLYLRFVDTSL